MQEFINQISTEIATGEREGYGLTPDEKETLDEAYAVLTKLIMLGIDTGNEKLKVASENLQEIVDEL